MGIELQAALVLLAVAGSAAALLRSAWSGIRAANAAQRRCGGCSACGPCTRD